MSKGEKTQFNSLNLNPKPGGPQSLRCLERTYPNECLCPARTSLKNFYEFLFTNNGRNFFLVTNKQAFLDTKQLLIFLRSFGWKFSSSFQAYLLFGDDEYLFIFQEAYAAAMLYLFNDPW